MRRKILTIFAFISNAIGSIVIAAAGLIYALRIITSDSSEIYTIGISGLFIFAAISALCFAFQPMVRLEDEKKNIIYAGEKFFHATLLIIQTILVKYSYNQIIIILNPEKQKILFYLTDGIFYIIVFICCSFAVYFSIFGFERLNDLLWKRYLNRIY